MKAKIQQRAHELGFDVCKVTSANPPQTGGEFQRWLAQGRHGEMGYMARSSEKRLEPEKTLENARSLVCVAVSYAISEGHSSGLGAAIPPTGKVGGAMGTSRPTVRGVVARYARFTDYHEVIGQRLKDLAGFVNELGGEGTHSLWYVDTGPILERDLAQRAGLGFIGKHTNLISRQFGNWIFLGEIITTLELEPDEPEKNRCGSCTRCIEICPTQAITGPFQLDARRCISYLTIELRGPIPVELRPAIGNRIFGCDDCLEVCPWNRFAREGRVMREHRRPDLEQPELVELLSLDEAGFRKRFAGTPILRAKRQGLLRNVSVALGNMGNDKALPALRRAAQGDDGLIAEHASWAIEQIRDRG